MKKLLLIVGIIVFVLFLINYCTDKGNTPKKEYKETMADGTICEWFEVRYEMEFVSTSRELKTEEYQGVANLFHFPKSKMVYFFLRDNRADGEHYGTLYMDSAVEVKK